VKKIENFLILNIQWLYIISLIHQGVFIGMILIRFLFLPTILPIFVSTLYLILYIIIGCIGIIIIFGSFMFKKNGKNEQNYIIRLYKDSELYKQLEERDEDLPDDLVERLLTDYFVTEKSVESGDNSE
jgi:hypothetical protein